MINLHKHFKENNKTKHGKIFTRIVYLIQLGFTIITLAALAIYVMRG